MAVGGAMLAMGIWTPQAATQEWEPWPESAFDEPEVYPTGEQADADTVALGDVTGDGRPDAVVATGRTAYELVVFAQGVDRSLAEAARLPLRSGDADELYPAEPAVALGDVDGDGDLDAVATGNTSVYYQHDGGLHGPVDAGIGQATLEVHLADLDGDGVTELLASASGAGVSVYRRGEDGFFSGGEITLADGSQPWNADEIEVGDINSDGRMDIVAFVGQTLGLYEARADGTYAMRLIELDYGSAEGIEVADLTGDGATDVVASIGNWARLFPQRNGAISEDFRDYVSTYYPEPVEAADIDRDGRVDLVTIDDYDVELGIWRQQSDGTLAVQETLDLPNGATDWNPKGLALGDVDCDGRVDAAAVDYVTGLVVVRQTFSGTADCPDPTAPPTKPKDRPPPAAPALAARRRQAAARVRRRGLRAVVTVPAGCRAKLALRTRRGRLLARKRLTAQGSHRVDLKPHRRVRRGVRLRVRAVFSCGDGGVTRVGRSVRLT